MCWRPDQRSRGHITMKKRIYLTCKHSFVLSGASLLLIVSLFYLRARSFNRNLAAFGMAVGLINHNSLHVGTQGEVTLPPGVRESTVNGYAYIVSGANGDRTVFFPTTRDTYTYEAPDGTSRKRIQLAGYVYSERPLPQLSWFTISGGNDLFENICYWSGDAVQGRWYYVEPFYSW